MYPKNAYQKISSQAKRLSHSFLCFMLCYLSISTEIYAQTERYIINGIPIENIEQDKSGSKMPLLTATAAGKTSATTQTTSAGKLEQVNINTATADELDRVLVGIGKNKAQAIVDYRTKNGAFLRPEQLTDVKGIGEGLLKKNVSRILL
ncbi:MAG: ComEA family DNA-binding protein [Plesiomonas sp.]|uniref:ComEA family DNA-binding protein n=1 Tax=Plesiomonas sp. TaxID=2486279 RepID=UPI003F3A3227